MRTSLHNLYRVARNGLHAWHGLLILLLMLACSTQVRAGAMSGTYTVCSSGCNYATIKAAVTDLYANGISASVTFQLSKQDYNEPIRLNASVTGASSSKTINF